MKYGYYGAELTGIYAKNEIYEGIRTPQDLYVALQKAWCIETCTPRLRHKWSKDNPTVGQCAITAFIVQDIFGGEIYEISLPQDALHCYNVVNGKCFDLTSEQFGDQAKNLCYENNGLQDRALRMSKPEKRERYELLKERLSAVTEI